MKKFLCFLAFLFSLPAFGQALSPAQLREDFDTLRSALEEAHGGLYRFYSKAEIDRRFEQYRKQLRAPMTAYAYYGFLSKFLATLGDGHMRIDFDPSTLATLPKPRLFPFRVMMDKDRMFILSNDTKTDAVAKPGMEIKSINGRTIKELQQIILPRLASDGYNQTGKRARFERSFSAYYWSYIDTTSVFVLKLKTPAGKSVTATLTGTPGAEREAHRNQNPVNQTVLSLTNPLEGPASNLWLRFVDDSTASLRIRLFDGKQFTGEIDSLFQLIASHPTNALILDLRGNRGGIDHLAAHLMAQLVGKPFRYLEKVHARVLIPSYATWKAKPPVDLVGGTVRGPAGGYFLQPALNKALAEQQPAKQPYKGKLVVLVGGYTFSAASDFSAILSHLTDAIFVGEETNGGYQGNTSALNAILKLPHSKFNVNIHLWDSWNAVSPPKHKGRGLLPDYPVERKVSDWLTGRDSQWEAALMICHGKGTTGQ